MRELFPITLRATIVERRTLSKRAGFFNVVERPHIHGQYGATSLLFLTHLPIQLGSVSKVIPALSSWLSFIIRSRGSLGE